MLCSYKYAVFLLALSVINVEEDCLHDLSENISYHFFFNQLLTN